MLEHQIIKGDKTYVKALWLRRPLGKCQVLNPAMVKPVHARRPTKHRGGIKVNVYPTFAWSHQATKGFLLPASKMRR